MAIIKWIENFLMDRQQCVVVDGSASEPLDVTSGVPRGSVLGPSLFLVYIYDIADIFSTALIRLFADMLFCTDQLLIMMTWMHFRES